MIVLHDDAHLLIFEIIEILWHKDSRFLDFSPQEQTIFLARNSAVFPLCLRSSFEDIKVLAKRPVKENSVFLGLFPEDDGIPLPSFFY